MSLYWSIKELGLKTVDPSIGDVNIDLIIIKNQEIDRTNELPSCASKYIKHEEISSEVTFKTTTLTYPEPDPTSPHLVPEPIAEITTRVETIEGIFPVEMSVGEKEVVDAEELAQAKEAKIEEIKLEAQRRVLEENDGNEIGIGFIHMTEHDQRNALALCLATVKAALDAIHGMDILSVLPQQQQNVYKSIQDVWNIIVTIRGISDSIELDVTNAETIDEVEAISVENNDKWLV